MVEERRSWPWWFLALWPLLLCATSAAGQHIPDSLVVDEWEQPPQMDPDSLSYLVRVDDLRQIRPPESWRERWHETAACLDDHGIERLPVAFEDYTFWTYRWAATHRSVISDLRGLHVGPEPPRQIFIREDQVRAPTLEHEFVHAQCGDECEHCADIFRACVGFVQNWCDRVG